MGDVELPDAQAILRRAVQIDEAVPAPVGLGPDALQAAAAELGVGQAAVAMALAESRAGVRPGRPGLGERIVGPRALSVARPCTVDAPAAARLSADWFERGHLLRVTTGADGSVIARRRTDPVAGAGRAVLSLRGGGGLSKIRELRSGVGGLADGTTAVCLQADVSDSRNGAVAVGSGIGTVAMAGVGLGTLVLSPFVVLAAPLAVAAGVLVARHSHGDTVERVRRSLEETAEAVAHGERPPTALRKAGRTLRRLARSERRR